MIAYIALLTVYRIHPNTKGQHRCCMWKNQILMVQKLGIPKPSAKKHRVSDKHFVDVCQIPLRQTHRFDKKNTKHPHLMGNQKPIGPSKHHCWQKLGFFDGPMAFQPVSSMPVAVDSVLGVLCRLADVHPSCV